MDVLRNILDRFWDPLHHILLVPLGECLLLTYLFPAPPRPSSPFSPSSLPQDLQLKVSWLWAETKISVWWRQNVFWHLKTGHLDLPAEIEDRSSQTDSNLKIFASWTPAPTGSDWFQFCVKDHYILLGGFVETGTCGVFFAGLHSHHSPTPWKDIGGSVSQLLRKQTNKILWAVLPKK